MHALWPCADTLKRNASVAVALLVPRVHHHKGDVRLLLLSLLLAKLVLTKLVLLLQLTKLVSKRHLHQPSPSHSELHELAPRICR